MSTNEIFLDPEYSRENPEEVIFRVAFNESGNLGLITSYHVVVKDTIFVGISLSTSGPWVAKMPLAIKEEISPHGLGKAASTLNSLIHQQIPAKLLNSLFKKFMQSGNPNSFIFESGTPTSNMPPDNMPPENFFGSPSTSESNRPPFDTPNGNIKFNFEDFLKEFDIEGEGTSPEDNGE